MDPIVSLGRRHPLTALQSTMEPLDTEEITNGVEEQLSNTGGQR
jgi:hypothetical protein